MRLCVTVPHRQLAVLQQDTAFQQRCRAAALLLELRLDLLTDATPATLRTTLAQLGAAHCLVSYRGSDDPRPWLNAALQAAAAYIDIASPAWAQLPRRATLPASSSQVLLSYHQDAAAAVPTLAQLSAWRQAAEAWGADVVKLALAPRGIADVVDLVKLAQQTHPWQRPLLALASGPYGVFTRLLGGLWAHPPPFTLARLPQQPGSAAGQLDYLTLQELYGLPQLRPGAPVYGLVGSNIAHAWSPQLHNTWLQAAPAPVITGRGIYVPFSVDDFAVFWQQLVPLLQLQGLSVTLPHKLAASQVCRSDPASQRCGAVNTLYRDPQDGSWRGTNTDIAAAQQTLARLFATPTAPAAPTTRQVILLGAGGVAHAVAAAAQQLQAQLFVSARRQAAAQALAARYNATVLPWHHWQKPVTPRTAPTPASRTVIVNCTPLGMPPHTEAMPCPPQHLPPSWHCFDTLYTPPQSRWLRAAAASGHPTVNGISMFHQQAAAQFTHFTGHPPPPLDNTPLA